jgi:hypothetical protein
MSDIAEKNLALLIVLKPRDKALTVPDFHGGAIDPLPGPDHRVFVLVADEAAGIDEVSVSANRIDAVLGHHGCAGGRKPGEASHSLMWDAVSACRAFLRSMSRSMPAGSALAFARNRTASVAKRSSKLSLGFSRSHFMETSTSSIDRG